MTHPDAEHLTDADSARTVIVGGGITGLAAAHRLLELDPQRKLLLLEAAPQLGGVLQTVRRDGYLIERSADNFITNVPWGVDLCGRLKLVDELLPTSMAQRQAFVVRRGKLYKIPQGFTLMTASRIWPILTTPLLSLRGKLRLFGEALVPRKKEGPEESLSQFVRRRLGDEVFERLVQPLVSGIYTADPQRLSVAATMPRFLQMERQHGSLARAMLHQWWSSTGPAETSGGARYSMFVTLKSGLDKLVDTLAARLPAGSIQLGTKLQKVEPTAAGFRLQVTQNDAGRDNGKTIACQELILATPAFAAADLLAPFDSGLAADLQSIPYAGTSIVSLGYRREQIGHPLDGFGFVVPATENRKIVAVSFSSIKFADRAPEGSVLLRVFIGGACQSELADLPDQELESVARQEIGELLSVSGDPQITEIARWPRAMPQYHIGHVGLVNRIFQQAARWPGLRLAGSAYRGVGIPNCIRSGEEAAESLLNQPPIADLPGSENGA